MLPAGLIDVTIKLLPMKKYCHTVRHSSISTLFSVLAGVCLTSENIFFLTTSLNAQKGELESPFIRAEIVTPQTDALMTSTGARTEKPAQKQNRLNPPAPQAGLTPERFSTPICNRRLQSIVESCSLSYSHLPFSRPNGRSPPRLA